MRPVTAAPSVPVDPRDTIYASSIPRVGVDHLSGPLPFYLALAMLAAVVVAKIVTMEMLRSHQRRLASVYELRDVALANLRAVTRVRKRHEFQRKNSERLKHKANLRIGRFKEELELMDFEHSSRQAHFDVLTSHVVER